MKPLSSILTLFVAVGALHCGDDDTAAPPAGTAGKAGASGKAGTGGSSGTGGTAGGAGASGKGGASGSAGKGGSAGKSGAAGAAGKSGAAGAAGKAGAAGAAGKSGAAGAAGAAGKSGAAGAAGAAGKAGAAGSTGGAAGSTAGAAGSTAGQGGSDVGGQAGTDQGGQGGDSGAGGSVIVIGDFTVAVAPAAVTVVQGQVVGIDVTVVKTAPFDSEITLTFDNLPTGLTAPAGPITIPAGATTVHVDFTAAADASVTTATITLHAKADGGFDKTATFDATVQQAPDFTVSADQTALTIAAGNSATLNVTIARVGGFADAVDVTFDNLPAGVSASAANIPGTDSTISVTLTVDPAAAVGVYGSIVIHAKSGAFDKTAPLSLTINPAVANITGAVAINAGDDGNSPFSDFRQGYTNVRIKLTGTNIAGVGAAGIRLGDLVPVLVQDKAGYTVAVFDIPHGESLGAKDIKVTNITGTGTQPGVITVTPIAVSNAGTDAGTVLTGRGTPAAPFRTIAKANTVSDSGDTIQLLTNTHGSEAYPVVLKPGTTLEGVPNGATLPALYTNGAAVACGVIVSDGATISKVRLLTCPVQKDGAALLSVNDVYAYGAGAVGFQLNAGETKFACTDPTLPCRVESKDKAIVVGVGAKLSGAPVVNVANEVAFQVDGIAELTAPQITGGAPVGFLVTGSATVKDGSFAQIGPATDDATRAAFVVAGEGALTVEGSTATLRRRGLLVKDNATAIVGGTWTGPSGSGAGAGTDANRYSIRLEGTAKLAARKLTSTQNNTATDFLQLTGSGVASIEDGVLASSTNTNRGVVGFPGATSAVTITGTSFTRFRSGAIVAQDTFGGSILVGAGSSFLNGGVAATNNTAFGALIDERTAQSVVITVASGVQFGGSLVPAGDKDAASAPLFYGSPANLIWYIPVTDAAKITFQ